MNHRLSTEQFLTYLNEQIPLQLLTHPDKLRFIDTTISKDDGAPLFGALNLIRSNQIQLIGKVEFDYLSNLSNDEYKETLDIVFSHSPSLILLTDSITLPPPFNSLADQQHATIASTSTNLFKVSTEIQHISNCQMAAQTSLHGVFMEISGAGILLKGDSGTGKSELALELINRGHKLIADDAVEFSQHTSKTLRGNCPKLLQDFLEVKGLGILNIRELFGSKAIRSTKTLQLIIELTSWNKEPPNENHQLDGDLNHTEILDIRIPRIKIPTSHGRNLAILVETAVQNHLLREHGYNSSKDLQSKLAIQLIESE